jgi:hypothetical protein
VVAGFLKDLKTRKGFLSDRFPFGFGYKVAQTHWKGSAMATTVERPAGSASDTAFLTVAGRVRDWAKTGSENVAFREKNFGLWEETTWSQFWELIQDAAAGLLSLGVGICWLHSANSFVQTGSSASIGAP